jgi:hypothetical protein
VSRMLVDRVTFDQPYLRLCLELSAYTSVRSGLKEKRYDTPVRDPAVRVYVPYSYS